MASSPVHFDTDPNTAADSHFPLTRTELDRHAEHILDICRRQGASAAEVELSQATGFSVTARQGDVETISHHRDKTLSVTTYASQRRGHASTADFSPEALAATVEKALTIARNTAADPFSGLADPDRLAHNWPDLDLYHPWAITVEDALTIACEAEAAALAVDRRLTNSEGATVARGESEFVYANSLGFLGGYRGSRHHIECAVIGEERGAMQRDSWYTLSRVPSALQSATEVGRMAGERTARRLNARRLATKECPVLFEPSEASELIGAFIRAVSGGSLYRKTSFLPDALGKTVFAPHISLREMPLLPRGEASAPFDDEGVATADRDIVRNGVLEGYFLGSYAARKLGMASTGNAGGAHNLTLSHSDEDQAALLRRMGRGLLVTEQLGHGINPVTGDFSRGIAGFWIEDGAIAYPVEEITIAGNLRDLFRDIVAIGNDIDLRDTCRIGSMLVSRLSVAGQ